MDSSGFGELEVRGRYISVPSGSSMEPLFTHKENAVEIVKAVHPLRRYDISLHEDDSGRGVLHRVMEVRDGSYLICGDNCTVPEEVPAERVKGVVTRFYRNGRWISVDDRRYRWYVRLWCGTFPLRRYVIRIRNRIKKRRAGCIK